jgi:hypothetical protein
VAESGLEVELDEERAATGLNDVCDCAINHVVLNGSLRSAMLSFTEPPRGHERWWMRRTLVERFRVTAPRGEQRKLSNGGVGNGLAVRPLATCAAMSAERASWAAADSKADLRFVHD